MAVQYGIACDWCRKVHFVAPSGKSGRFRYNRYRQEFAVQCIPPCKHVFNFHRTMLVPYVVTEEAVERGMLILSTAVPLLKANEFWSPQCLVRPLRSVFRLVCAWAE